MTAIAAPPPAPAPAPTLSPEQFLKFRDFIYGKCGIYFAENKKYLLENRLGNRLKALALRNADEYYMFLRYDPRGKQELDGLFAEITINETSFWRHLPQLEVFRDALLPDAIESRRKAGQQRLHLWSAACSSGEEPYTLAILLRERLGSELPRWQTSIFANDLSSKILEAARQARYGEYALRNVPPRVKAKYFKPAPGGLCDLDAEVRGMVVFEQANLVERGHLARAKDADVIFCRNVLIYFDEAAKKKVVEGFYESLRKGGYLMIGPAESLHGISQAFKMIHFNQAVVYQKE